MQTRYHQNSVGRNSRHICSRLLFEEDDVVDGLTKKDFKQLLTIATTESFILFNNAFYQQIDGVAIGSPL